MTVFDGIASLTITSTTHAASAVTDALGIMPTLSAEKGALLSGGSTWSVDVSAEQASAHAAHDDTAGFASVEELLRILDGKGPALALLRDGGHYEMVIRWHGTAGSTQGGFVMPIELIRGLAELGCSLHGNLYSAVG